MNASSTRKVLLQVEGRVAQLERRSRRLGVADGVLYTLVGIGLVLAAWLAFLSAQKNAIFDF